MILPHFAKSIGALFILLATGSFFSSCQVLAVEDPMNPGIDEKVFETALTGSGVDGWVHGQLGPLAVFVYRERDFFHYGIFPMVSHIPSVVDSLKTIHRHDKIHIKGRIISNGAPQRHIYVTELKVLAPWKGGRTDSDDQPVPQYEYEAKVPEELLSKSEFVGKIHFAAQDGSFLVCEYKDVVLPVVGIVGKANDLYRNDKVKIHYTIQSSPTVPTHLVLDGSLLTPVEIIQKQVDLHGKKTCVDGSLAKFPKSPEVSFDVYALQNTDADRVVIDYTLINFEHPDLFAAIRKKSADMWDLHKDSVVNGRNKLLNNRIHVHACGTLNVVSPSQANPQVIIEKLDDLTVSYQ